MAMTKTSGWSISALATEFGLDRRTVAKRLDGVAPSGTVNCAPVWALADAATALASPATVKRSPAVPQGFADLVHLPPIEQVAVYSLRALAYRVPAQAAILARALGMPADHAGALYAAMQHAVKLAVADVGAITGAGAITLDGDLFDGVDWSSIGPEDEGRI